MASVLLVSPLLTFFLSFLQVSPLLTFFLSFLQVSPLLTFFLSFLQVSPLLTFFLSFLQVSPLLTFFLSFLQVSPLLTFFLSFLQAAKMMANERNLEHVADAMSADAVAPGTQGSKMPCFEEKMAPAGDPGWLLRFDPITWPFKALYWLTMSFLQAFNLMLIFGAVAYTIYIVSGHTKYMTYRLLAPRRMTLTIDDNQQQLYATLPPIFHDALAPGML
ncbi:hypothetical protein PLESTB_000878000 [Pleodorina starrii]|uniref:Uncharacterized protein n=1 Tax=Pleodorina starrii TaxID=330485 RepID=A0A9W6BM43_9CHLO|nr:hypothetical protein PLESTB_000878000 [Pleodorina starrii]